MLFSVHIAIMELDRDYLYTSTEGMLQNAKMYNGMQMGHCRVLL